ncbi:MAG TPA: M23 family metallopeptidase [Blastocatellia bacterium]|nr:M23 family metallopeptidase [Blastocatellia bacterium]
MSIKRPRTVFPIAISAMIFAALIAVWNQPALLRVGTLVWLLRERAPPKLPVPVEQVAPKELADTWGAPRSDNRRHEGIDIFAPLGRPVISTTHGVVFKVGEDNLGGHVVRVLGPGWQWHYYAHLDRFGDVEPGSIVQPGTVLGFVGNTGNAIGTPHHLHYGVYRFLGGARNPYPLLAVDQPDSKVTKLTRRDARKVATRHAPAKRFKSRAPRRGD